MLHQITIHRTGKIFISRQSGKKIRRFSLQVNDPGKFAAWLYALPYIQFAHKKESYTLFVRK